MAKKHILIVCGEPSGELHAFYLIKALKEINSDLTFWGVGGSLLAGLGVEIIYDIKDLAVFGFFDVLKKLPRFFYLKKTLLKKIRQDPPGAVVLIDFSGFNLRLAQAINKQIPLIYYVSPQVWASRPGRIETIRKYISQMIVIFPLEKDFYLKHGIHATFVGHPLLDIVKPTLEKEVFLSRFNLAVDKTTLALLPGSRKSEIKHILPVMLKASRLIQEKIKNLQCLIAKSINVDWLVYQKLTAESGLDLEIIEGKTYDCLNIADFCLVASGTATLETAIMEKPFVIVYKMGLLNYLLYRPQVKVPYIGMANLVAGKKIIPEFIQFQAKPHLIARKVLRFLQEPSEISRLKNNLSQVKLLLGEKGASLRAAKIILDLIRG